jgi:uncharacterized membrane protein YiaA
MNALIGIVFVFILGAFANPFMLYMPSQGEYLAAAVLAVVAAIFVGLVFREAARDEREESLRARAARWGYLAGVAILTLGIIVPVVRGFHADGWVLLALALMIISRLASRAVAE